MTVADDVTLDDLILAKDDLSGADIKVEIEDINLPLFHLYSNTPSVSQIFSKFTLGILQRVTTYSY